MSNASEDHSRFSHRSEPTGREVVPATPSKAPAPSERALEKVRSSLKQTAPEHQADRVKQELKAAQNTPVVDQRHGLLRTLVTFLTIGVEMIPGGLGPYGIGDALTALEAAVGRTIDGLHLTPWERVLYLGASVIPVIPARPFIAGYRYLKDLRKH